MDEINYYSCVKRQEDRDEQRKKEEAALHWGTEGSDTEAAPSEAGAYLQKIGHRWIPCE